MNAINRDKSSEPNIFKRVPYRDIIKKEHVMWDII